MTLLDWLSAVTLIGVGIGAIALVVFAWNYEDWWLQEKKRELSRRIDGDWDQ